jgi:hypothetical protein
MVTVVAITFGVNDLGSILPMIGCQVAMSYFLCAFERMNRHRAFVSGGYERAKWRSERAS